MPVEFLVTAQVPVQSGLQSTQRAAEVYVVAPGKINQPQLAHQDLPAGWQTQYQGIPARWPSFGLRDLDLEPGIEQTREAANGFVLPLIGRRGAE